MPLEIAVEIHLVGKMQLPGNLLHRQGGMLQIIACLHQDIFDNPLRRCPATVGLDGGREVFRRQSQPRGIKIQVPVLGVETGQKCEDLSGQRTATIFIERSR